ncbi:SAM-dependent methyltransferase [bacterium]|nr:SAM-dependent methyltransferase [bacterium]
MFIEFLQKNKFFRRIISKSAQARAAGIITRIKPFLDKNDLILDLGAGTCHICKILSQKGHKVIPLDVQDLSFTDNIKPIIYDGNKIPYGNNKFDKALILTVLHHTPDPEKILREAKRTAKRIIVMEDIYSHTIHKHLTYFFDSLLNLEFTHHPHTNKNDTQWRKTFKKLGLKLVDVKYSHSFPVFTHAFYYLKK